MFTRNFLPSVRAYLVKQLYQKYHLTQEEVSKILGITQPAVSQYLTGVRGSKMELHQRVINKINENAKKIYSLYKDSKLNAIEIKEIFCDICEEIKIIQYNH
ncbi:MAG: transcriptional regulator [Candidatus Hermodarchaeota archaeon]